MHPVSLHSFMRVERVVLSRQSVGQIKLPGHVTPKTGDEEAARLTKVGARGTQIERATRVV